MSNTLILLGFIFYCTLFYFIGYLAHQEKVKDILTSKFSDGLKLYLVRDLVRNLIPSKNDTMYSGFDK